MLLARHQAELDLLHPEIRTVKVCKSKRRDPEESRRCYSNLVGGEGFEPPTPTMSR